MHITIAVIQYTKWITAFCVMTRQYIIEHTNRFLTEELDIEAELIQPDTELKRDIGISSVDAVAIAAFIQKTFGCKILMQQVKAIITINDLYDYIEQNMTHDA